MGETERSLRGDLACQFSARQRRSVAVAPGRFKCLSVGSCFLDVASSVSGRMSLMLATDRNIDCFCSENTAMPPRAAALRFCTPFCGEERPDGEDPNLSFVRRNLRSSLPGLGEADRFVVPLRSLEGEGGVEVKLGA
jgi:hypothetical protein